MDTWEEYDDCYYMEHNLYIDNYPNMIENENAFKRHLLFEVLDYLGIIEYSRGYDGHYYIVEIRKRNGK